MGEQVSDTAATAPKGACVMLQGASAPPPPAREESRRSRQGAQRRVGVLAARAALQRGTGGGEDTTPTLTCPGCHHYSHYDLLVGHHAAVDVFPVVAGALSELTEEVNGGAKELIGDDEEGGDATQMPDGREELATDAEVGMTSR